MLYFESRSRDSNDLQLAVGVTEEVIRVLGGIERLDVRSRLVSRRLADGGVDPLAAARGLGLAYLVTGTLEPAGERIRIHAEMMRSSNGRMVWSRSFDRPRAQLASLVDELAGVVAYQVAGVLLPRPSEHRGAVRPTDPLVYELVVRSRALFNEYTGPASRAARTLLEQAVARDSTYAPAWTVLAWVWALGRDFGFPADESSRQSTAAARRALALDSSDGSALGALAGTAALDLDLSAHMESLIRRATVLAPRDPNTIGAACFLLVLRGRDDEGLAACRAAIALDTLAPVSRTNLMYRLMDVRRYDEGLEVYRALVALDPGRASQFQAYPAQVARQRGRCDEALRLYQAARSNGGIIASLACAGRVTEARAMLDSVRGRNRVGPVTWALLQQPDSALAFIADALDQHRAFDPELLLDPALDPLRSDPRFVALMRRMGLP